MDWWLIGFSAPVILAIVLTLLGRWWAPGKGEHGLEGRGTLPYDAPRWG